LGALLGGETMGAVTTKLGTQLCGNPVTVRGAEAPVSITSTKRRTAIPAVNTAICLRTVDSLCLGIHV